jgi:hypothetical protein
LSDIVERLEGWALDLAVGRNCRGADQDIRKAADEIVRLRAEVEEARANSMSNWGQRERAEAAEAERDRLRDALRYIEWSNDSKWQSDCARAALKGDTP